MSRRLKRALIVLAALLVVGAAFVWALPELVKWQAVKQIAALTGRQVSIEDIDVNLFTGRVAIKRFRLAEQDPAQTFVGFERLDVRVVPWAVVRRTFRFAELRLTGPTVNLVRRSPAEFNFSDILERLAAAPEAPKGRPSEPDATSRWVVALDRFALIRANIQATDRAVTPASEWKIRDLTIEADNLSTAPSGPRGTLDVRAALNESPVEFSAQDIDLTPTSFAGKFSIQNFNLLQVRPYLPPLPVVLESGIAGVTMAVKLELGQGPGGLAVGLVTGDVAVTALALSQPGKTTPFLTVPRIGVALREADLVAHAVKLSAVDVEGLDLRAVRDKQEQIDLLDLAKPPEEAKGASPPAPAGKPTAAPAPAAEAPAKSQSPDYQITIDKIGVKGAVTFTDESVSTPATVLKVPDLALQLDDVTWPAVRPLQLALTMSLPGGGKFGAKGPVRIEPLDATLAVTTRDAPIEPYRAYFPFPARFSGRFNADSQNRIRMVKGNLTAQSRGNSWATNLAVKGPDDEEAPLRLERMELSGVDFGWPTHARVARVLLRKPSNEIDRAADGSLNVQKLFTPTPKPGASGSTGPAKAPAARARPPAAERPEPDPLQTMDLSFKEIVIEEGYIRFLDHTTRPPFSNDISKLHLSVKNLSNKAGQRAAVELKAVIGGDSTLAVRGQLSAIGAPTYVNMATELNKFALSSANPYVDQAIAWIIRRGELTAKLDTTIDGEKLDAKNDILIGNLRVARSRPSEEVKNRLGLPLGLVVALIKDGDGNIHVKVPISGTLNDQQFDWSDAIWTAVRNVIVNVLKAPFRAVGGLFTSGDKIEELRIDPITFAPGDGALSPEMERHTVRVADFLRRSPYVSLTLTSVTTPEDVSALKAREVTAKLDFFQKEKKIGDRERAIRRYYEANYKGVPLPPTVEEQIAWLRQREPEPIGPLAALRQQRLQVTRDRLSKVEGIPEARLQTEGAPSPDGAAAASGSAASPAPSPGSGAATTPGASGTAVPPAAPAAPGATPGPGSAGPPATTTAPGAPSRAPAPDAAASGASTSGRAPAPGTGSPSESATAPAPADAAPSRESAGGATTAAEPAAKSSTSGGGRVEFGIVGESD